MTSLTAPAVQESTGLAAFRRGSGSGSHPHRERRVREIHPTLVRKPNPHRLVIHSLAWQASAIAVGSREVARLYGIPRSSFCGCHLKVLVDSESAAVNGFESVDVFTLWIEPL